MPVPARPRQRRSAQTTGSSPAVLSALLVVTAAGAGAAVGLAPEGARPWVAGTAIAAWGCIAAVVAFASARLRQAHRETVSRTGELEMTKNNWMQHGAETDQLVNVTLPAIAKQLNEGVGADGVLSGLPTPSDPYLRRMLHVFTTEVAASVRRTAEAQSDLDMMRRELARGTEELERLTNDTLPAAVALLREGSSADTVLAKLDWPSIPLLRSPAESFIRELAYAERRSAAAQAASAKALSRVQAKTVGMLADLRDMQDRHAGEIFGDLLRLDHSTSQLGLMTDRLALLMGGRSSRVWNKPIVMESILRGSVGRIAAYRRVRLHNSSKVAIAGFAAEGVMHLLAELMDNAANFSPPIDEVHVYVEERSAGLVITIEDSGLKMSDASMRRAAESVSGQVTDLASLQGTRLGLSVVGRLAAKHGISVNYRPSSRGGTGVVVLLPPQLVAQQREPVTPEPPRRGAEVPTAASAPAVEEALPLRPQAVAPAGEAPRADVPVRPTAATPNGLPVRAPGRTMAEAERGRPKTTAEPSRAEPSGTGPARDAGSQFGAFHRGRQAGGSSAGSPAGPGDDAGHETGAEADD
ncbi:ATP-binding protein [Streptomyces sp. IB201691-2A2]|uniref:ATP-binding protein n=1 Tax=Streptomyces sp. IB201691-2A2 TaxID=2561920 RepID=UPI00117DF573|nr:ATP-binding protein [Streptomyces sp. IB201691-2A2]TRO57522.1 ATP-binding protein [Streptomyces sp. IB201691-2A2]